MKENEQRSKEIYKQNWAPVFKKYPIDKCLVTGYSCREQVKRMEDFEALHPVELLNKVLD
jgi:Fe-S oxidoreductase